MNKAKIAKSAYRTAIYVILIASSAVLLIPFAWMVSSSLLSEEEMFQHPPVWIPKPPHWSNYKEAWEALPFTTFLINTLLLTIGRVLPQVFACSLVAFGFARLRARASSKLFFLCLATMMLPGQVTMIPTYIIFNKLGWVNTFKPLIVPSFFAGPFFVFMLRQFFLTIPLELDEAARIDGASSFQIYYKIFLPLAKPALGAVAIFSFMAAWNDFMGPLIYLHDIEKYPLALGLQLFQSYGEYATRWNLIMASSVAMVLLPLIVFFFTQKHFIKGITIGAFR